MRVYKVMGNLWELTPYQFLYGNVAAATLKNGYKKVVTDLLEWKTFSSTGLRLFTDKSIRSKGRVIIQFSDTEFRDYDVYFDKKGFYSNVKGKKTYLNELIDEKTLFAEKECGI